MDDLCLMKLFRLCNILCTCINAHKTHTLTNVCTVHLPQIYISHKSHHIHTPTNVSTINVTLSNRSKLWIHTHMHTTHTRLQFFSNKEKKTATRKSYFRFPSHEYSHTRSLTMIIVMMSMMTQTTQTLYNNWANTLRYATLLDSTRLDSNLFCNPWLCKRGESIQTMRDGERDNIESESMQFDFQ